MSKISTDPYLFFKGGAKEALEFYKSVFGGEVELMTYDSMKADPPEGMTGDAIMHGSLTGEVTLMASDTAEASPVAKKVTICLGGDEEERMTKLFEKLSEGVEVQYPLKKEMWGDTFGSFVDKYGIEWMFNIESKKE